MIARSDRALAPSTAERAGSGGRRAIRSWWKGALANVSLIWLILVAVMAVFGILVTPYDPTDIHLDRRLLPPMTQIDGSLYALGTDDIGRDYLSRLIIGARASVMIGFIGAAVATGFALIVGSVAGYVGGRADAITSRVIDAQLAFPAILIAILLLISVGPSAGAVILVLAIGSWPGIARLVRSLALAIRKSAYIESAMALDAGATHIIRRHVVPNLFAPVLVVGVITVAQMMLASAGLDFLGLGIQPPDTSWGILISIGLDYIQSAWWLITLPGLAMFLTVLSVNLVATRLRGERRAADYIARAQSLQVAAGPGAEDLARLDDLDDEGVGTEVDAADPAGQSDDGVMSSAPGSGILIGVGADGSGERSAVAEQRVGNVSDRAGDPPAIQTGYADALGSHDGQAPVLVVEGLSVDFFGGASVAHAVRGASWAVYPGEVLAIVGESGSGKSVTARTIMGILERPQGAVTGGRVLLKGRDLLSMSRKEGQAIYGSVVTMVQQDAVAALDPVTTIGAHLEEVIRAHNPGLTRSEIRKRALELLDRVGIPDPATRFDQYPFQFSGGMCQRVLIAMAIANDPEVLVADEPTTSLDVSIQAQIMDLLMELQAAYRMSLVLITHDLGLVYERADRIVVMYAGTVMESGTVADIIERPGNPYTQALLRARPDITAGRSRLEVVPGVPPNAARLPAGCPFQSRCPMAIDVCRSEIPPAVVLAPGHASACHRAREAYQR